MGKGSPSSGAWLGQHWPTTSSASVYICFDICSSNVNMYIYMHNIIHIYMRIYLWSSNSEASLNRLAIIMLLPIFDTCGIIDKKFIVTNKLQILYINNICMLLMKNSYWRIAKNKYFNVIGNSIEFVIYYLYFLSRSIPKSVIFNTCFTQRKF